MIHDLAPPLSIWARLTFEFVQDLQDDVTSSVILVLSFDEQLTNSRYSSIFDAGNSWIGVTELANNFALPINNTKSTNMQYLTIDWFVFASSL